MKGKTLIIIGAGIMQTPAIIEAKKMGLRTLVMDYNPKASGMKIADIPVRMSTKDIEGAVRTAKYYAQYLDIVGVITVGTDASMTVSAVSQALSLPGIKFESAEKATNKIKMRKCFLENNVGSAKFKDVWSYDEAVRAIRQIGLPAVIKPADNMGARGVTKITDLKYFKKRFEDAKAASPSGQVLIEEFLEGPEFSIDMLIYEDEPVLFIIADRIIEYEPFFVETGHILPSQYPEDVLQQIKDLMIKGAKALGINNGAAKGDVRLTKDGPKFVELAARLSGGYMSGYTCPYATGINIIKAAIEIAIGKKPKLDENRLNKVCIEKAIIPNKGIVTEIKGIDAVRGIKGVKEIFLHIKEGDYFSSPKCNLDKAINIIVCENTIEESKNCLKQALSKIEIKTSVTKPLTEEQIRENALKRFQGVCRVCSVCNGIACAGEMPGMGSIGKGGGFIRNIKELEKILIKPHYLMDNFTPDTSISIFNTNLSFPVIVAPITGAKTNLGGGITEEEYVQAVVEGSRRSGVISMVGDGATPDKYKIGLSVIANADGIGIPIFKPRGNLEEIKERLEAAKQINCLACGMDVDAVSLATMDKRGFFTRHYSAYELKGLIKKYKTPFIIKGVLSKEDALEAILTEAEAIVISNHGGRVLESLPTAYDVISEIKEIIDGQLKIFIDGGVRSGEDVFKCLALGADAVLIGRPVTIFAMGGGAAGVELYLNKIKKEFEKTMLLTGCHNVSEINLDKIIKLNSK